MLVFSWTWKEQRHIAGYVGYIYRFMVSEQGLSNVSSRTYVSSLEDILLGFLEIFLKILYNYDLWYHCHKSFHVFKRTLMELTIDFFEKINKYMIYKQRIYKNKKFNLVRG